MFVESMGTWDFEIDMEAQHPVDVMRMTQSLYELCGGELERVQVLSELEDYKFSFFPL